MGDKKNEKHDIKGLKPNQNKNKYQRRSKVFKDELRKKVEEFGQVKSHGSKVYPATDKPPEHQLRSLKLSDADTNTCNHKDDHRRTDTELKPEDKCQPVHKQSQIKNKNAQPGRKNTGTDKPKGSTEESETEESFMSNRGPDNEPDEIEEQGRAKTQTQESITEMDCEIVSIEYTISNEKQTASGWNSNENETSKHANEFQTPVKNMEQTNTLMDEYGTTVKTQESIVEEDYGGNHDLPTASSQSQEMATYSDTDSPPIYTIEQVNRDALNRCQVALVKDMRANDVLDHCIGDCVLPDIKCRDIQKLLTEDSDKNRRVIDLIQRSGPEGYKSFKRCLQESSHMSLFKKLEEEELNIKREKGFPGNATDYGQPTEIFSLDQGNQSMVCESSHDDGRQSDDSCTSSSASDSSPNPKKSGIVILHCEHDMREAAKFKTHLETDINQHLKVSLSEYTGAGHTKLGNLDFLVNKFDCILIYATENLKRDRWGKFKAETIQLKKVQDDEQGSCIPVFPQRSEIGMIGLDGVNGINYWKFNDPGLKDLYIQYLKDLFKL